MLELPSVPVPIPRGGRIAAVRATMDTDRLHLASDGIVDEEHVAPFARKGVRSFAEGESAQPGSAHFLSARLGKRRRIRTRYVITAQRIGRALEEGHHRPALVIRFLDERLALPVDDQAPDVARTPADHFELASVGPPSRELGFVERREVSGGGFDLRIVERPLSQP